MASLDIACQHQGFLHADGGPLAERDDAVRVLADVALADLLHELVATLVDLDRLQVVLVQPDLQAIDENLARTAILP